MLELDIRRRQGDFRLEVACRAEPGRVTALFGRSGAGKTSVIAMAAGLARPDGGVVRCRGRVLFDASRGIDLPPERRRMGCVFQDGRLFPHLSVRGNLVYGLNRRPAAERTVALDEVVDLLGLAPLLGRRPAGLSGGEKQRVAVGRALLAAPDALLMDEPLASLDHARKRDVLPFVAGLARRFAIPVLYVSHDLDEILALADTLVILEDGRVAADGEVGEVVRRRDLRHLTGQADSGALIAAVVAAHDDAGGLTLLRFAGGELRVARQPAPVGATLRVHIRAGDVALALEEPRRTSVRNVLPGTVTRIDADDGPLVDVHLDVGCPLLARITRASRRDLGLAPGLRVLALVKSVAVSPCDLPGSGAGP